MNHLTRRIMKRNLLLFITIVLTLSAFVEASITVKLDRSITVDSLGACQGISYQKGRIFLYGDREVGMIREFKMVNDSLVYQHKEVKLTQTGRMLLIIQRV
jgi:hypothetical protein